MKVSVSSYGPNLDSRAQPIFGRCAYLIFVDPLSMEFESVPNPHAASSEEAGIRSAQFVIDKGVSAVLTDRVGEKAAPLLAAANIEAASTGGGTVREALEAFRGRG